MLGIKLHSLKNSNFVIAPLASLSFLKSWMASLLPSLVCVVPNSP